MTATSNALDNALERLRDLDPKLAETVTREVDALRRSRKFGLVFEKHLPESVRLTNHPIKRGVTVALKAPDKDQEGQMWTVAKVTGKGPKRVAHLVDVNSPVPVSELVVVRAFGEPVYPGLKSLGRIANGPADAPWHTVINGENFHALQALRMTHSGKVDLIYIDPPYNTGNKGWIYNDRYVAEKDGDKHSKWLSFIERRLTLAKDLLKETGIIIVAIGDDEHHRLRMVMDQVFGTENFISNVVWQGGRKNDSRFVSNGADYMLIYAKDQEVWSVSGVKVKDSPDVHSLSSDEIRLRGARWREAKAGYYEALATASRIWQDHEGDSHAANSEWKSWLKQMKKAGAISDAVARSDILEDETGRPINTYGNLTWPGAGGHFYEVLHPETRRPCKTPSTGWRFADPDRMNEEIEAGRVWFGADETTIPRGITYLDEMGVIVPLSVFDQDRKPSNTHMRDIFGEIRFPNPKDARVLERWIGMATPTDAVILDFFAGSGSTAEAVYRLNSKDGGTRQCIVVTNNELAARDASKLKKAGHRPGDPEWEAKGVFEYVTRPRIETVVTGTRPDGSTYSDGLEANVEFFELTYLDEDRVSLAREFEAIAPLLWMQAGGVDERIDEISPDGYAVTDRYAVLFDVDATEEFIAALAERETPVDLAFIVTDSTTAYESATSQLPSGTATHRLYESYLRNFEINTEIA